MSKEEFIGSRHHVECQPDSPSDAARLAQLQRRAEKYEKALREIAYAHGPVSGTLRFMRETACEALKT